MINHRILLQKKQTNCELGFFMFSLSPLSHIYKLEHIFVRFISHSLFLHLSAHQLVANEQTNPAIVSL